MVDGMMPETLAGRLDAPTFCPEKTVGSFLRPMGFGQPVPVQYSAPEQVTDTCCYGGLEAGFFRRKKHGGCVLLNTLTSEVLQRTFLP